MTVGENVAVITDIQRYSVHDGPGIRSLVFFKGCPLRCQWCHNPETHSPKPELLFNGELCIGCGSCLKACPQGAIGVQGNLPSTDRSLCTACGACVEKCYAEARSISGRLYTLQEVVDVVMRDAEFYRHSGGGVTLSGGEVLMQAEFATQLLRRLKAEHIHTAIETCGFGAWEHFEAMLRYTDLVLFDVKHSDAQMHEHYTGQSNRLIIENLYRAADMGKEIIARLPLIPGVNDAPETLQAIAAIAQRAHAKELHILPFHQIGASKWDMSGKKYAFRDYPEPSSKDIDNILNRVGDLGLPVVIGGN